MATWRVSEPAGATEVPVGAGYIRDNNTQIQSVLTAARLVAGSEIPDVFDTGGVVKQWFYLDAAPTGWTEIAAVGDTLLAVKGGTTYTTGGAPAGTWTQDDHDLTLAEIPAHTHTFECTISANSGSGGAFWAATSNSLPTGSVLGGAATGSGHSHGATWRPAARVGLLCSFD